MSNSLVFVKTNADEDTAIAKKYGVVGFPTMVFTRPNGAEVDRLVGYYPPESFIPAVLDLFTNRNTLDDLLSKAVKYPDSLELYSSIAQNYEYKNDMANARYYYGRIISLDSANESGLSDDAWMSLAGLKRRDGEVEEAVKMYFQTAEKFPESDQLDDAYLAAAAVYRRDGQVDKAIKLYEDFEENYPASDDIDYAAAMIPYTYHKNGEFKKALELYKTFVEEFPDSEMNEWAQGKVTEVEEEMKEKK